MSEAIQKKEAQSVAQQVFDAYFPAVSEQISQPGKPLDEYSRQCISNGLVAINEVAVAGGLKNLSEIPRSDLMAMMQRLGSLKLNAFAQPREVYFTTRKKKDSSGQWSTTVEMGIEGDGNDAILRNFGRDVDMVYPFWVVREGDTFEYPSYHGIEVTPPEWTPCGTGKVLRVVYPIRFKDGTVRYFIGERAAVRTNLVAHIRNNLMNETFGICESRYKATVDQKNQIEAKKKELLTLCDGKTVDEILAIEQLRPYISDAWLMDDRMIERKMRNNVVKAIPKDFSEPAAAAFVEASEADEDRIYVESREVQEPAPLREIPLPEERRPAQETPAATAKPQKAPF